ncbi:hypothetical protein DY78_GL000187 [Lactiplantibacillus fabifermentans DSM 21115]|uniref:HTH cro/C1-type domain-containing protein n=1 Tax=Lactiplantibacillus fabifermentans DSM 21115 TaxID=1413187 RepID=A0A0R2NS17_9LACO|nr:hypothetical protein DY78_GL000187 [Lactiplantibacillus fabifermentans DSM 21115]
MAIFVMVKRFLVVNIVDLWLPLAIVIAEKCRIKEVIDMSKIDEYASRRRQDDAQFAQAAQLANINLVVAVQVRALREQLGLTQRAFAQLIHKPQSTVARLETGAMNASTKLLSEIALATNQQVTIEFSPLVKA